MEKVDSIYGKREVHCECDSVDWLFLYNNYRDQYYFPEIVVRCNKCKMNKWVYRDWKIKRKIERHYKRYQKEQNN